MNWRKLLKGMKMNATSTLINSGTVAVPIITFLLAWILRSALVPFLDGYSRRKGENLATHEDLDNAIEQLKAVTLTKENIKAAISDDVWDRQKQWEMRRDAVFEAVRAMKELELELISLRSVHLTIQDFASPGAMGHRKNSMSGFLASSVKFYSSIFMSELSLGEDFGNTLLAYYHAVLSIGHEFEKGNPEFCTSEKFREILDLSEKVLEVARKKLNIKNTV
jgi:hypothetical protein